MFVFNPEVVGDACALPPSCERVCAQLVSENHVSGCKADLLRIEECGNRHDAITLALALNLIRRTGSSKHSVLRLLRDDLELLILGTYRPLGHERFRFDREGRVSCLGHLKLQIMDTYTPEVRLVACNVEDHSQTAEDRAAQK